VADAARKMTPAAAIEVLPYSKKVAAGPLMKVVKTAVANAKQGGADETRLKFVEIQISEGPVLKRGIPVSRGQWHPILKRMSHIRVIVAEREVVKPREAKPKAETVKKTKKVTKTETTK
jgi:large subunit ribosomal protein L22